VLPAARRGQLQGRQAPAPRHESQYWKPADPPPNAPKPDYGEFWQRHEPPPPDLLAPLAQETPIEAMLHGPRVRAVMGRLAVDEIDAEEQARPSSLAPVHRARYDRAYEQDLLRQLKLANELTLKEHGPKPLYQPPPEPKRKPDLQRFRVRVETDMAGRQEQQAEETPQQGDEMDIKQAAAAATLAATALTTGALSGCEESQDYSKVKFQPNPEPKERYELTVEVKDAPGLFKYADGSTNMQIVNQDCLPPRMAFTGAPRPGARDQDGVLVDLTQTSPTTWQGKFSVDGMLEAPYYGRAVCRWDFVGVDVSLMATGAKGETLFGASLSLSQVREGKPVALYFRKSSYPREPDPILNNFGYSVFSGLGRSRYGPGITDADLFAITLTAKKVTP
jgi:hypothetical protein